MVTYFFLTCGTSHKKPFVPTVKAVGLPRCIDRRLSQSTCRCVARIAGPPIHIQVPQQGCKWYGRYDGAGPSVELCLGIVEVDTLFLHNFTKIRFLLHPTLHRHSM